MKSTDSNSDDEPDPDYILSPDDLLLTRECVVCMRANSLDQFEKSYSNECQHVQRTVCNRCVYQHIKHVLKGESRNNVSCPEPNCPVHFTYATIRSILLSHGATDLFHKYDDQLARQSLEQNPNYFVCPYSDCRLGQFQDMTRNTTACITCVYCQRMICSFHRTVWHTDMTCDKYDQCQTSANHSTKLWLKRHTKLCPKCRRPIEKILGCDHITCICRYEFCWECLANFQRITQHGLHHHRITCSHYSIRNVVCTLL
ncbi:unnamed protein product [Rotaria sp. Silwood1]|nr:unnamed protein product [Rotaria sp. Silwood1]CAF3649606.1 unnamed protein product [Rotaria sp. Silwood1]CAF5008111.1 unnamed protein product [Rotaria sp. Silwood1]